MPTQQPKAAIAAIEDPLLEAYAKAWQDILDLQEQIAADPAKWRRRRRLAELQQAVEDKMAELDARTREWAASELVRPYALGAAAGATELGQSAAAVWTMLPEEAISRLATDTMNDLLKSTRYTRRTTKSLIRAVAKDEILAKLVRGDTAVQAGQRVRQLLEQKGIHAIRYKDGSRHGLAEYSQMLVRTKTAVAYNLGTLESQEALGIEFWECFDGTGCGLTSHQDPRKALGQIVDKDTALAYPIAHPNCRRAWGARPDITAPSTARASNERKTAEAQAPVQPSTPTGLTGRAAFESVDDVIDQLPANLASAVNRYQSLGYRSLNEALRRGRKLDPSDQSLFDRMTAAFAESQKLSRPRTQPLTTSRGMGNAAKRVDGLKPGDVVTDKAFMSTSTDEYTASRFGENGKTPAVWSITVPPEVPVMRLPGGGELELLLRPGTRMKILQIELREGIRHVRVEVIP
jgi:hypothetical protein